MGILSGYPSSLLYNAVVFFRPFAYSTELHPMVGRQDFLCQHHIRFWRSRPHLVLNGNFDSPIVYTFKKAVLPCFCNPGCTPHSISVFGFIGSSHRHQTSAPFLHY